MSQAHLIVSGKVQGVFYRASCQEVAQALGLTGWIRNLSDGNVEALVQGEKEKIEKLIEWCKKGPAGAKVNNVNITWGNAQEEFKNFDVK